MTVQLTILGLNQIGLSIGLSLSAHTDQLHRVGHDRDSGSHALAEKMGAVDETRLLLRDSVQDADLIVLCQPAAQSIETLQLIASDLKAECVVLDTSSSPVAFLKAAAEILPQNVYALSFVPAIAPQYLLESPLDSESAHADLFKNSTIAISSSTNATTGALQLATDLATLMDANVMYSDPFEIGGLLAGAETMPQMAAAALLNAVTSQPGWHEGRKLAGSTFALTTLPAEYQPDLKAAAASLLLEQDNNLRVLDNYLAALNQLRALIVAENSEALEQWLKSATEAREEWLTARATREFEHVNEKVEIPTVGETFGRLLGIRKRKPKDK